MHMWPAKPIASETSASLGAPRYLGSTPAKLGSRNHGPTDSSSTHVCIAAWMSSTT